MKTIIYANVSNSILLAYLAIYTTHICSMITYPQQNKQIDKKDSICSFHNVVVKNWKPYFTMN